MLADKSKEPAWRRNLRYHIKKKIEEARAKPKNKKVRHTQESSVKTTRKIVLLMKQVPCADCKKFFPPCCMDFDHVRGKKVANVSKIAADGRIEDLLAEIEKCEVVCAICHRIRTAKRNNERPEVYTYPAHAKPDKVD